MEEYQHDNLDLLAIMYAGITLPNVLLNIYTKKKVKHPHVFFKWQMIQQVSRDYWPDNPQERNGDLLGHYIGCKKPHKKIKKNVNLMNI